MYNQSFQIGNTLSDNGNPNSSLTSSHILLNEELDIALNSASSNFDFPNLFDVSTISCLHFPLRIILSKTASQSPAQPFTLEAIDFTI